MRTRLQFICYLCAAGVCIPYSEQACRDAAAAEGLSVGSSGFSGNFAHKGCYAYTDGKHEGKAFYGTGGTVAHMQKQLPANRYRPKNYDCAAGMYVCMDTCLRTWTCMSVFACMYACLYIACVR